MKKVDHPAGFELVTATSFVFCPGAEHHMVFRALARRPAIYMGSSLQNYDLGMDSLEVDLTDIEAYKRSYGQTGTTLDPHTTETNDTRQYGDPSRRADATIISVFQLVERYIKDAQFALLPDYEAADFPFYKQYLYWHQLQQQPN